MPPSHTFSHYVAPFCRERGIGKYKQDQAVCGAWVSSFSTEPTCSACRAYVEADAQTAAELAEKWDAEDEEKHHAL